MPVYRMRDKMEVDSNEGGGGAGCQSVGSPINLNNTGTRFSENTATQYLVDVKGNKYSLDLTELMDLYGRIYLQLNGPHK